MRFKLVITSLLSIALVSFTLPVELEVKSLLDDKIEIKIPKDFTLMSQEMLELKYPGANRPKLVYTNDAGSINVAFNHSTSKASQGQLDEFLKLLKKTFQSVHKNAEFLEDDVKEINGKKVGYIKLITQAVDTRVFNHIFFTDVDGRMLLCTFNCTEKHIKEWKGIGEEIASSLTVK